MAIINKYWEFLKYGKNMKRSTKIQFEYKEILTTFLQHFKLYRFLFVDFENFPIEKLIKMILLNKKKSFKDILVKKHIMFIKNIHIGHFCRLLNSNVIEDWRSNLPESEALRNEWYFDSVAINSGALNTPPPN